MRQIKIAITGLPGTGKTTLIRRLSSFLQERGIELAGFYTVELREGGKRVGFDIVTLPQERRIPLARVGSGRARVGRYRVLVENLDEVCRGMLSSSQPALYIVDELGKMELFSSEFLKLMDRVLKGNFLLTYGKKLRHPIKDRLLRLPDLENFEINPSNREELYIKIRQLIESRL